MQPGDVPVTYADTQALEKLVGYKPKVSIEEGMENFVQWFIKIGCELFILIAFKSTRKKIDYHE